MKILICITPLLMALAGCSTVTTPHPIGNALSTSLSKELNGSWMASAGHQLQLQCDDAGNLSLAAVEWKGDPGRFELESHTGILRSLGDLLLFNFIEDEEDRAYTFVLIRVWDGQIVVWTPDVSRFQALVKEGKLAGDIHTTSASSSVHLTGSSAEITEFLESVDPGDLFEWTDPAVVLVRINGK